MFGGQQATSNQSARVPGASGLRGFRHGGAAGRLAGAARGCCRRTRAGRRTSSPRTGCRGCARSSRRTALAGREQQPPGRHEVGDRRAGLAVDEVGRQLVLVAERLALEAGADRAVEVHLLATIDSHCRSAAVEQGRLAGLQVHVDDAGQQVQRAHRVADRGGLSRTGRRPGSRRSRSGAAPARRGRARR